MSGVAAWATYIMFRGRPCLIQARGTFLEDLPSVEMSLDVQIRVDGGQTARILAVKDDFCDWADFDQGGHSSCPPKAGLATISVDVSLARGWIPEVSIMSGKTYPPYARYQGCFRASMGLT